MVSGALILTACEPGPTDPEPSPPPPDLQAVSCVAELAAARMLCTIATAGPRPAATGPITVGGQGIYVLLTSAGTSYSSGTGSFNTTVTVKNLTAQPLGTADGASADADGIEVFFHTGPSVTGGSGSVSVANADGSGSFTGPNQPFYRYAGNLAGGATTAGKVWNFSVTGSVTTFTFQVFVRARVPQATGILRFLPDSLGTGTTYSISGTSPTNVLATGVFVVDELLGGRILRWNGVSWTIFSDFADLLYGSWVIGATVYAVGPDGVIWFTSDNGANWTRTRISSGVLLVSAWAGATNDLYAAGGDGTILHSTNGTSWTPMASGSTQFLNWIWGTAANDVFAVGYGGTILHFDGSTWSGQTPPAGSASAILYGVGGTPGGTLFVVGEAGRILRSVNGGATWTADASGTANTLRAVWCVAPDDCLAVGDLGTVRRWNGTAWSPMASGTTRLLRTGWGASTTSVFLAGDQGTMLRGVR